MGMRSNVAHQRAHHLVLGAGAIIIADAIKDMGALTKLDISSNFIAAAQGEDLQRICAVGGIELAK
jgi:hypothetical protein